MANIEYKSEEEQNRRTDFNPYNAPMEEIEEDWKILYNNFKNYFSKLSDIIYEEHQPNMDLANEHFDKILKASASSSPFDKSLINNSKIKAIDEVKLSDFKYEKTFRECLNAYYHLLWYIDAMETDNDALVNKVWDLLVKSPVSESRLIDELVSNYYDAKNVNYTNYQIILQLIHDFTVTEIKSMIHDTEQNYYELMDLAAKSKKINVKKCPKCGYENVSSISKCFKCGYKF